jgi:hypothetical protein
VLAERLQARVDLRVPGASVHIEVAPSVVEALLTLLARIAAHRREQGVQIPHPRPAARDGRYRADNPA